MALQKSQTQDIQTIVGNGLAIYQDGTTGLLMLKDVNGKTIPLQNYFEGDQDNIGRTIEVESSELPLEGTIREKISEYVNSLSYDKQPTDAEIWVDVSNGLTGFVLSLDTYNACLDPLPGLPVGIGEFHNGIGNLPVVGDTIFDDPDGTQPIANIDQSEARVVILDGVSQYFIATDSKGVVVEILCEQVGGGR